MKLFNEIESEVAGTIVKIMVEDASPVEYDQVLFLVE
jgi:acetyl-CoA carboxylase biotin carboxyl carrier protein